MLSFNEEYKILSEVQNELDGAHGKAKLFLQIRSMQIELSQKLSLISILLSVQIFMMAMIIWRIW